MSKQELTRHFAECDLPVQFLDADPRPQWQIGTETVISPNTMGFIDVQPGRLLPRRAQRFHIYVHPQVEMQVVDKAPKSQHLLAVLRHQPELGGQTLKRHFVLGHDERQLFVVGVEPAASVTEALKSLRPPQLRLAERRGWKIIRQGDWFFVPVRQRWISPEERGIPYYNQQLGGMSARFWSIRTGNPHVAEEQRVVIEDVPRLIGGTTRKVRAITMIFVRGKIRHAEHSTLDLKGWYQAFQSQGAFQSGIGYID
jgi:hypothetical protein